jgi:response regulator RpfG family c-di-GMP phosphodiesterase
LNPRGTNHRLASFYSIESVKRSGLVARTLIVEDEPQVLTSAASVLQQAGYEVISAATGRSGY